jgi:methyl-galactoside transport system permease protein
LQIISVALQWLSVSGDMQYIIKGAIILVAVAIDMRKYLAKK